MEIEDREYIERAVAVIVSVAIKTTPASMIQSLAKGPPLSRDAAHRDLVKRITTTLSLHFEMGQIDCNSGLYVTNYIVRASRYICGTRRVSAPAATDILARWRFLIRAKISGCRIGPRRLYASASL